MANKNVLQKIEEIKNLLDLDRSQVSIYSEIARNNEGKILVENKSEKITLIKKYPDWLRLEIEVPPGALSTAKVFDNKNIVTVVSGEMEDVYKPGMIYKTNNAIPVRAFQTTQIKNRSKDNYLLCYFDIINKP